MLLELKRLRDPRVIAVTSNEKKTGADMDWWFVRPATGENFRLTIQAKILHYRQQNASLWHYEDLAHPRNAPGRQSRALIKEARRMRRQGISNYPYYLFYNPAGAQINCSRHSWHWGVAGSVTAIDGFMTAGHIAQHIGANGLPINGRRLSALAGMMVSLPDLLCSHLGDIPSPEEMSHRIDAIWRSEPRVIEIGRRFRRTMPIVGSELPAAIRRLVDARGARVGGGDEAPARDTVVFLSRE